MRCITYNQVRTFEKGFLSAFCSWSDLLPVQSQEDWKMGTRLLPQRQDPTSDTWQQIQSDLIRTLWYNIWLWYILSCHSVERFKTWLDRYLHQDVLDFYRNLYSMYKSYLDTNASVHTIHHGITTVKRKTTMECPPLHLWFEPPCYAGSILTCFEVNMSAAIKRGRLEIKSCRGKGKWWASIDRHLLVIFNTFVILHHFHWNISKPFCYDKSSYQGLNSYLFKRQIIFIDTYLIVIIVPKLIMTVIEKGINLLQMWVFDPEIEALTDIKSTTYVSCTEESKADDLQLIQLLVSSTLPSRQLSRKHFPFIGRLRDACCTMERRPLDNMFLRVLFCQRPLLHIASMKRHSIRILSLLLGIKFNLIGYGGHITMRD